MLAEVDTADAKGLRQMFRRRQVKKTQFAINYMQLFEQGFDLFDVVPAEETRFAVADDVADPVESRSLQRVMIVAK